MSATTDPIKEFIQTCEQLRGHNGKSVGQHLASVFDVTLESADFYRMMTIINERVKIVNDIIGEMNLDKDLLGDAINHTFAIEQLFKPQQINNPWDQVSANTISDLNTRPIKMLSMQARGIVSYQELSKQEIDELLALCNELLGWLREQQFTEYDFIRENIVHGIENFIFSLKRFVWIGRHHSLQSLRQVVSAYMAMESGMQASHDDNTLVLAAAKRTKQLLIAATEALTGAKKAYDAARFALDVYGATQLYINHSPTIRGLISHI